MSDGITEESITKVAAELMGKHGLTQEQAVAYILRGEIRHEDAREEECGVIDPRDDRHWCRRPKGHKDTEDPNHNRYHLPEDWQ